MNTTKRCFVNITLLLFLIPFIGSAQNLDIKIDKIYQKKYRAKTDTLYNLHVDELLSHCVNVYGRASGETARLLQLGDNDFEINQEVSSIAVAKLFAIPGSANSNFQFGNNCGEKTFNSADVSVSYDRQPPSTSQSPAETAEFNISASSNVYEVNNNNPGNYNGQQFLRVNASEDNTATISIQSHSEQGNVFVNLIPVGGDQKSLIALHHSKSQTQGPLSFTVNQSVLVMPLIGPKVGTSAANELIYEIGDPKRNAKILVEEEIEEN